jgi:hypothetical protein
MTEASGRIPAGNGSMYPHVVLSRDIKFLLEDESVLPTGDISTLAREIANRSSSISYKGETPVDKSDFLRLFDSGRISLEDENTFVRYLQRVYSEASKAQQVEISKSAPDRLYLHHLAALVAKVQELESLYLKPGTLEISQHISNQRLLSSLLSRVSAAEPQLEPAPSDRPAKSPQSSLINLPRGPGGRIVSPRSEEERDAIADLIYRVNQGRASEQDQKDYRVLRDEDPNLYRSGKNRLRKLLNLRFSLEQSGKNPGELSSLKKRFPESLGLRGLSLLLESSNLRLEIDSSGALLKIWPDPAKPEEFYVARHRDSTWERDGLVKRQAVDQPAKSSAPADTATPAQEETPKYEDEDTRRIEDLLKKADPVIPEQEDEVLQELVKEWQYVTRMLRLQRLRPDLRPGLQKAINRIREGDEPEIKKEVDPKVLGNALRKATQYRHGGTSWWKYGINRRIDEIYRADTTSIQVSRKSPDGVEYRVDAQGNFSGSGHPIYFWVPRSKESKPHSQEAMIRTGAFLDAILTEQDVSADPKGEAPDSAFNRPSPESGPPIPPDGDPVGAPPLPTSSPEHPVEKTPDQAPTQSDLSKYPRRVVVTQKDQWWIFSWNNWVQFLIQGAAGSQWNLDHWGARVPSGRPSDIREYVSFDQGPPKYFSTDQNSNVYNVQGWQPRRCKAELDYIQALDISGISLLEPKPPQEDIGTSPLAL